MTSVLESYLQRIQADHQGLRFSSARLDSDGMMNDAVILDEALVFRFAKSDQARSLLGYEAKVLDAVQRHVTAAVPRIEFLTEDYMSYRFVPGAPLYNHRLMRANAEFQARIAADLGDYLRQLHALPLGEVPDPPWQEAAGTGDKRAKYELQLEDLREHVYPLLWADQKAWIEDLFDPVLDGSLDLDAYNPVFIHRDLASYHILHDPESGRLTGVIDYGTAGPGDPAVDWGILISGYGEQFVRQVHRTYPVSQATMDRARFLAGRAELEWALIGVRNQDPSMLLVHLGRARDVKPIMSPWL